MSYTGSDMKSIIGEILEKKKADGGIKSLYFVGCGGSLGALYPAKSFMERESADIKCALISSNEFVHSTPKDFGIFLAAKSIWGIPLLRKAIKSPTSAKRPSATRRKSSIFSPIPMNR